MSQQPPSPPPSPSPSPSPPPSPSPAPAAASGKGSSAGKTAGRFSVDPGPAFDAEHRPQTEPVAEVEPEVVQLWDERRVRVLLGAKGAALHALVAVEKESTEWVYTQRDLEAIAPPLTAILNRYDATRAAAAAGDELAVAIGFFGYAGRSWRERQQALARLAAQEPVPVTGVAAPREDAAQAAEFYAAQGGIPDPDEEPAPIGGRRR